MNYDDFDFGSVTLTYRFEKGQKLPDVGHVIKNDTCTLVVTSVDKENSSVQVLLTAIESISNRLNKYKEEIEEHIEKIAELLYKRTTSGMVAKIGWENLSSDNKESYLTLANDIVLHLDEAGLLILKYK